MIKINGMIAIKWLNVFFVWMMLASCGNNNSSSQTQTITAVKNDSVVKDTLQLQKQNLVVKTDSVLPIVFQPIKTDSSKKYIYLTFDDGPQKGTDTVFELCKRLGVKATFFMVGLHANQKTDGHKIVNAIRNNYPQTLLANHSFTHANDKYHYFYEHPDMAEQDFYEAQQSLHVPFKIIRLPGNSAWITNNSFKSSNLVKAVCEKLNTTGYNIIGWDVEWEFNHKTAYPVQSPERMARMVDSALARNNTHTANHIVILSHDRMFRLQQYSDELEKFISILKQNPNYVFETIDHYPNLKKLQ